MAVALNQRIFTSPVLLTQFVADAGNNVTTITAITYDPVSATYTLFWV